MLLSLPHRIINLKIQQSGWMQLLNTIKTKLDNVIMKVQNKFKNIFKLLQELIALVQNYAQLLNGCAQYLKYQSQSVQNQQHTNIKMTKYYVIKARIKRIATMRNKQNQQYTTHFNYNLVTMNTISIRIVVLKLKQGIIQCKMRGKSKIAQSYLQNLKMHIILTRQKRYFCSNSFPVTTVQYATYLSILKLQKNMSFSMQKQQITNYALMSKKI
eukprot:TRINITY_DN5719_c0_g3_i2.p2 TRINITY_DN5719_c0_g3~~TRINITY_DN5719_c0_g3_i2.p2  ORF type:complete len:214 (-),score=-12.34 TRINITY_DN5719_c0_g3_i2:393-1034(-)